MAAALGELREFGAAVIDDRAIHGAEDAVRQRRRSGNMEEVAARHTRSILGHRFVLEFCEIEKFGRGPVTRNCTPHNLRAEMRRMKIACNYRGLKDSPRLQTPQMIAFIRGRCN